MTTAGQIALALGFLSERGGAQLDLIAEAGVETLSPASIVLGAIAAEEAALDAGEHLDGWLCDPSSDCDDDECAAHREVERALDDDADAYADREW